MLVHLQAWQLRPYHLPITIWCPRTKHQSIGTDDQRGLLRLGDGHVYEPVLEIGEAVARIDRGRLSESITNGPTLWG